MDQQVLYKKRRTQRACDVCRRKKIKCEGESAPGAPCTACVAFREDCTWNTEVKKRGPPRKDVQALEARLAFLENLLQQKAANPTPSFGSHTSFSSPTPGVSSSGDVPTEDEGSEDEDKIETLAERMDRLEVDAGINLRHVGESSGAHLAGKVWQIRTGMQNRTHENDTPRLAGVMDTWEREENEMWRDWEADLRFNFPEPDLLAAVVEAYMIHVNAWSHLLHRPTFEAAIANRLHERDNTFACVLLLVCALGSRYVDDPRVNLPETSQRSAGWPFYMQVPISRWELTTPPRLYNVQMYCLAAQFISTVVQRLAWKLIGIGIRMCQEIGMQHRKLFGSDPHPYHELWKRCFWALFTFDVLWASETGRPSGWHEADFDIDLPLDCDDEYWFNADTSKAFQQPSGQPSRIGQYIELIKLKLIHARALRTLFSPASSKHLKDPAAALAEIDSEIDNWADQLPVHQRWDPHNSALNLDRLLQTGLLQLECNQLRLTIHRPFVAVRKPTAASASSHAMCTLAARSNSRIAATLLSRVPSGYPLPAVVLMFAHSAGIVLLLNYWGTQHTNMRADSTETMADIDNCLAVLRSFNKGLHSRVAKLLHDQLTSMASRSDMSLTLSPGVKKRPRDPLGSPSVANATMMDPGLSEPASLGRLFNAPTAGTTAGTQPIAQHHDLPPVAVDSPTLFWKQLVSGEISPSGIPSQPAVQWATAPDTDEQVIVHDLLDGPQPARVQAGEGTPLVAGNDHLAWDNEFLSLWATHGMNHAHAGVQSEHPDHLFHPSQTLVELPGGGPEHLSYASYPSWQSDFR